MYTFSGATEKRFENLWKTARRIALFHGWMLANSTVLGLILLAVYYFTGTRGTDLAFRFLAGLSMGEGIAALMSFTTAWRFSKIEALVNMIIFAAVIYWLIHFGGQALLWGLHALSITF